MSALTPTHVDPTPAAQWYAEKRAAKLPGPGKGRTAPTKATTKSSLKLPDFSPPQLCESVDWAHDYERPIQQ
jgi:hypothetical protein